MNSNNTKPSKNKNDLSQSDNNYIREKEMTNNGITWHNKLAFGMLYFLEGASFGQVVGFLPLVLANIYCISITKSIATYSQLFPWILKPVYSHFLRKPQIKHLKFIWLLLILVSGIWLYVQYQIMDNFENQMQKFYNNSTINIDRDTIDTIPQENQQQSVELQLEQDDIIQKQKDKIYRYILIFGSILQILTVNLDVIVDYVQVCTLRERQTLGWVKTIEVGLYKVGSLVGGSILLLFTTDISTSILFLCLMYFIVGGLALFIFKLPPIPQENHIALKHENQENEQIQDNNTSEYENECQKLNVKNNEDTANKTDISDIENQSNVLNNQKSAKVKSKKNGKLPPYILELYKTKFFIIYLLTYKVCQGFLQKIFPQWMVNEANPSYSISTANLICGLFTGLTSLAGTIVGGWIPKWAKERHMKLRKSNASRWTKLKSDIWFWLIILIWIIAIFLVFMVTLTRYNSKTNISENIQNLNNIGEEDIDNILNNSNSSTSINIEINEINEINESHVCKIDLNKTLSTKTINKSADQWLNLRLDFLYDGLGISYNIVFILMFITLTFIGGIITNLTFTEMTAKAQDIDLKYANQYLSWLSMLEIIGKYIFAVFSGSLVDFMGYYKSYYLVCFVQVGTIFSFIMSKFEEDDSFGN